MLLAYKHFVYAGDMAKKFEIYFDPLVPTEINGRQVVDYTKPSLQTYRATGLQFELASFPEEVEAIESYFRWYRPQAGDLIFDVGAHCGVSTHYLAQLVGATGGVIAFEPDPVNLTLLQRNISRHGLKNVTVVAAALSDKDGTAAFLAEGTIGSTLEDFSTRGTVGKSVEVPTYTLATAFEKWGRPKFCKVDIEGAEIALFDRARDVLRKGGVNYAVDTNHLVDGAFSAGRIENIFRDCGMESVSDMAAGTTWGRPQ